MLEIRKCSETTVMTDYRDLWYEMQMNSGNQATRILSFDWSLKMILAFPDKKNQKDKNDVNLIWGGYGAGYDPNWRWVGNYMLQGGNKCMTIGKTEYPIVEKYATFSCNENHIN